ncbi:scavenger receptor cysteine-rich domain-containing protein DMBT1-like [Pluvialis apricaria]
MYVFSSLEEITMDPYTTPENTTFATTTNGAGSCGGLLQGLSGSVVSPGYPNSYPNNARCVWYIRLQELDLRVELQFLDVELEGDNCYYDAIEVYDGGSLGSPLLGTVCTNNHRAFKSSGHQLTILFRSDVSVTRRGFQAHYYAFRASGNTTGKSRAVRDSVPGQKHKRLLKALLTAPDTYGMQTLWPHWQALWLGAIFLDRTATRLPPED